MKTVTMFEVTRNTDGVEGRGSTVPTGIAFTSLTSATEFVCSNHYKQYAVMGVINERYAKHNVRRSTTVVYDCLDDFENNSEKVQLEKNKAKALEKLSKDEIEALKELGF